MAVKKINTKRKRKLDGIEDVAGQAANVLQTKMRYDYELSLTPEERQQRYEDQKKTGKVVFIGLAILTTGFLIYSFSHSNEPKIK